MVVNVMSLGYLGRILSMSKLKKLEKKLTKLEKRYDQAEGKTILQARIMKTAESTIKQIELIKGGI